MRSMAAGSIGLLTVALLLGVMVSPAFADWRRVDSPNFTVLGDVSAGELREIASRFETFRDVLSRLLSQNATVSPVPTIVFVFSSDRALTPFKPKFNGRPIELTGLFLPRRDVNYIALVRGFGEDAMRVVFHEYAHLITANATGTLPLWLSEGLAEFYSTFKMVGDQEALIGRAVPGHLNRLNAAMALSLDELVTVRHDSPLYNEGNRRSVFYAQAWALTHFLLVGPPPRRDKLEAYIARLEAGTPPLVAWKQAFGSERIDLELQNYVRRPVLNVYRLKFADKTRSFQGSAEPMKPEIAEAFLAQFLAAQERYDEALDRIDRAARTDPDSPWLAVVRSLIALDRKDRSAARAGFLGIPPPADWLLAYFAATGLSDLATDRSETAPAAPQHAARTMFELAQKTRGEIPNALARLAALDGEARPTAASIKAIERARAAAPGRHDYTFLHARLLAQSDDLAAAANVLRPLTTATVAQEIRDPARSFLAQIEDRQRRGPALGAAASTSRFVASFRTIRPGETRLDGVLERIECDGKSVRFVLTTVDGPVARHAAALDQVEFISYREGLGGSIACGALKEPMKVYVTHTSGADGALPRVVAIEFLPLAK